MAAKKAAVKKAPAKRAAAKMPAARKAAKPAKKAAKAKKPAKRAAVEKVVILVAEEAVRPGRVRKPAKADHKKGWVGKKQ